MLEWITINHFRRITINLKHHWRSRLYVWLEWNHNIISLVKRGDYMLTFFSWELVNTYVLLKVLLIIELKIRKQEFADKINNNTAQLSIGLLLPILDRIGSHHIFSCSQWHATYDKRHTVKGVAKWAPPPLQNLEDQFHTPIHTWRGGGQIMQWA